MIDRGRHRDRKTKTRQAFPSAGRAITTRTATAQVAIWRPARGLTITAHRRLPEPRNGRTRNRPPARSDSRAVPMSVTLRNRNSRRSRLTQKAVTDTLHAQVHGIAL